MAHNEKVVLFPKWKSNLEEEGLKYLKAGNYMEALERFNQLLAFHVVSPDIITGKLICLMELGMYEQAEEICREEMAKKDKNYYQYAHIYFTLLFQTNQYDLLMQQLEDELSSAELPETERNQFQQLYDISTSMQMDLRREKSNDLLTDLQEAIEKEDSQKQSVIITTLTRLKAKPRDWVLKLLQKEDIHPVIKTSILEWLQKIEWPDSIHIHKFGMMAELKPSKTPSIAENPTVKAILKVHEEIEQENPTLYQMLLKLTTHYNYVRYPFLPPEKDAEHIAAAILYIGMKYLNLPVKELSNGDKTYLAEIELSDTLYASIIDD